MRRSLNVRAVLIASLSLVPLALIAAESCAAGSTDVKNSDEAARLVQAALDAELKGDLTARSTLLAAALKADPNYAPAHWQSGQVKFEGQWRSVAEVGERVTTDARWANYRQRLASIRETIDDQAAVAAWCQREGLANEERYHWANVLLADPSHKQARERLGLLPFADGLYTADQVAQLKDSARQAAKDMAQYRPKMVALCTKAMSRGAEHADALKEIMAVNDPAKLRALEYAVSKACQKAPDDLSENLQLAYVAALSSMPQHSATLRLLNYAVLSSSAELRARATQGLVTRPPTDYVPLLMAALSTPYEAETSVFAAPDGTVRLFQTVTQTGAEASQRQTRNVNFETRGALNFNKATSNPAAVLQRNIAQAEARAADTESKIAAANKGIAERNRRIGEVLKGATNSQPTDSEDPEKWWQDWQTYNELSYDDARPVYDTYDYETYTYDYPQAAPATGSPTLTATRQAHECFAAGTLVWLQSGPQPIETIAAGDLVLTENPLTGELGYRPVRETTVSQPVNVVELTLPGEKVVCTLGHRFWVDGHGWEMAKSMTPGAQLHGLEGALQMSAATKRDATVCYNLVVDDFHTYFVGTARLLTHDKTCPTPNAASLPGSRKLREPSAVSHAFADELAQTSAKQ